MQLNKILIELRWLILKTPVPKSNRDFGRKATEEERRQFLSISLECELNVKQINSLLYYDVHATFRYVCSILVAKSLISCDLSYKKYRPYYLPIPHAIPQNKNNLQAIERRPNSTFKY